MRRLLTSPRIGLVIFVADRLLLAIHTSFPPFLPSSEHRRHFAAIELLDIFPQWHTLDTFFMVILGGNTHNRIHCWPLAKLSGRLLEIFYITHLLLSLILEHSCTSWFERIEC